MSNDNRTNYDSCKNPVNHKGTYDTFYKVIGLNIVVCAFYITLRLYSHFDSTMLTLLAILTIGVIFVKIQVFQEMMLVFGGMVVIADKVIA
jgi:hypothetical protein